jgi:hypothetical protein
MAQAKSPHTNRPGPSEGSRVADDLVEAFEQMAAHLRGEIALEAHDVPAAAAKRRRASVAMRLT